MLVCVLLGNVRPELSVVCALATCAVLLLFTLRGVGSVLDYIKRLSAQFDLQDGYIETVFKVIGIGYICTFAAQLCKDAGQASVGVQVELFGKVLILMQALPIAGKLIETLTGIL